MAKSKSDDVRWIDEGLPNINRSIYIFDDPTAELKVPKNKGHEAMAYLTYIIDNYDRLPDTVLFFHPHRVSWHNNILLDLDLVQTITRLSDARVARTGYFNSRCHHDPGCPDWLHLDRPKAEWDLTKKKEEQYFTSAVWRELHPGSPLPHAISQPCCAQFAVSGDRIRSQPLAKYVHLRNWLLNTKLEDAISGRVMEYTWQYVFTGEVEFCPAQHECYCDGYGICFGSEAGLQGWLDLLRKRELLDDEIHDEIHGFTKTTAGGAAEKKNVTDLTRRRDEIRFELRRLRLEAIERGQDPRNRAMEAGRPWEEGDGF